MVQLGYAELVKELLEKEGMKVDVYGKVDPEPTSRQRPMPSMKWPKGKIRPDRRTGGRKLHGHGQADRDRRAQ